MGVRCLSGQRVGQAASEPAQFARDVGPRIRKTPHGLSLPVGIVFLHHRRFGPTADSRDELLLRRADRRLRVSHRDQPLLAVDGGEGRMDSLFLSVADYMVVSDLESAGSAISGSA